MKIGDRVEIIDIAEDDSFYKAKDFLVGASGIIIDVTPTSVGSAPANLVSYGNDWYSCSMVITSLLDFGNALDLPVYYFFKVQLKRRNYEQA